jgi:hypothetical protein
MTEGKRLVFGPRSLQVAHRRMRQGLLMRRTDDLAIVAFETPSGDRRFLVYDLRDDLATTLAIGRKLSLDIACTWDGLRRSSELPPDWPRKVVGN